MQSCLIEIIPSALSIDCAVNIPGSKSYTNRALIIAAQAGGQTTLYNASISDDCTAMCKALEKLGIEIKVDREKIVIGGTGGNFKPFHGEIDVGPAGTAMRFLTALCSSIPGCDVILSGSKRMHQRPIADLVEALTCLGAQIDYVGECNCPPLRIRGRELSGGPLSLNGGVSSQFFTALLLVAPRMQDPLQIEVVGEQISPSYVSMTIDTMADFGVKVTNSCFKHYLLAGQQLYQAGSYRIDGDASGASYLWAVAAITAGRVKVGNLNPISSQGDLEFPNILEKMGCRIERPLGPNEDWIAVTGSRVLKPVEVNMSALPDTAQTLAVLCACAQGRSVISGLGTLRYKETDRIAALEYELVKVGINAIGKRDSLLVHGGQPSAAIIDTYNDHRMAMSFAVLGARIAGIKLRNPEVVNKSFPGFWEILKQIGLGVREL